MPPARPASAPASAASGTGSIVADYGVRLRPWPDIPLGIAVGVAAQFALVPLLELPLAAVRAQPQPAARAPDASAPRAGERAPASSSSRSSSASGARSSRSCSSAACCSAGLLGKVSRLGRRLGPAVGRSSSPGSSSASCTSSRCSSSAWPASGWCSPTSPTGPDRLGPSIVAHVSFNATTVVAYVLTHSK